MHPPQACVFSIDHIIYKQSLTEVVVFKSYGPNYFLLPQSVKEPRKLPQKEKKKEEEEKDKKLMKKVEVDTN